MKRVFGVFEAVFDVFYLCAALIAAGALLLTAAGNEARLLAGAMALLLVGGDAFHLLPRIRVILTGQEERLRSALGRGKQITSVTMTVFYLLLWRLGQVLYAPGSSGFWTICVCFLAGARILLCFFPQNKWRERYPPVRWGVYRNVPFFLLGIIVAGFFFLNRDRTPGLDWMWLAILLSFGFYLPVVLWANRNPKVGMLMLPKTCAYLWMLFMCFAL